VESPRGQERGENGGAYKMPASFFSLRTWLPERRRRNTGTGASGISSDSVYRETSASKNPSLCLICISPGGEEKRRITSPGR